MSEYIYTGVTSPMELGILLEAETEAEGRLALAQEAFRKFCGGRWEIKSLSGCSAVVCGAFGELAAVHFQHQRKEADSDRDNQYRFTGLRGEDGKPKYRYIAVLRTDGSGNVEGRVTELTEDNAADWEKVHIFAHFGEDR